MKKTVFLLIIAIGVTLISWKGFSYTKNTFFKNRNARLVSSNKVLKDIKNQLIYPLCLENFEKPEDFQKIEKYFGPFLQAPNEPAVSLEVTQESYFREFEEAFRPRLSGEQNQRKTDCEIFNRTDTENALQYNENFIEKPVPSGISPVPDKMYMYVFWPFPNYRATIHIDVFNGEYKFGGTGVSGFGTIPEDVMPIK